MDSRSQSARVGTRVSQAISKARIGRASVAEVIDLTSPELELRLAGAEEFSVAQLVSVGGLLRVSSADLAGVV